ncbi:uncharacterized protein LOC119098719 [Pollicipes pollicipes]|uniref:uncharacterized protein LOC119098719 n=1 Tax=Pollicipes pollicipes TaxID=41117 RepID=UPI0018849E95|nr:uncharacterized protein LOC119098719 [Pollicipes pollicipes]
MASDLHALYALLEEAKTQKKELLYSRPARTAPADFHRYLDHLTTHGTELSDPSQLVDHCIREAEPGVQELVRSLLEEEQQRWTRAEQILSQQAERPLSPGPPAFTRTTATRTTATRTAGLDESSDASEEPPSPAGWTEHSSAAEIEARPDRPRAGQHRPDTSVGADSAVPTPRSDDRARDTPADDTGGRAAQLSEDAPQRDVTQAAGVGEVISRSGGGRHEPRQDAG